MPDWSTKKGERTERDDGERGSESEFRLQIFSSGASKLLS
jgi:hypothetical protein